MSKAKRDDDGDTRLTIRLSSEKKRQIKMRAAQVGCDTVTEYIHSRIDEDLEDADLPELQ